MKRVIYIGLRFLLVFIMACRSLALQAQPPYETIRIVGTINETVTIQAAGEKYVINHLPLEIQLRQEQIPLTITIESPNYEYRPISIPKYTKKDFKIAKQTGDAINRTYLIYGEKIQQTSQAQSTPVATNNRTTEQPQMAVLSSDVDTPPIIGNAGNNENTFAIVIANENYLREVEVPYALNDGKAFSMYCQSTLGLQPSHIKTINNATLNDLKYNLNWLKQVADAYQGEAKFIFYYAGHGIPHEKQLDAYILPVDGYATDPSSGLSLRELYDILSTIPSKSVAVFLDACFSGTKRDGDMLVAARGVAIKVENTAPKGNVVVFAATQGDETAYPFEEKKHGMFTYYLLKKLQQTQGNATLKDLQEYVTTQVKRQSIVINGKMQTPTITSSQYVGQNWEKWKLK